MTAPLAHAKSILRSQVRVQLEKLSGVEKGAASAEICSRLRQQEVWKAAKSVLFYAPLPDEPDIWPLLHESLASGRTVALPRFDTAQKSYVACRIQNPQTDLQTGHFGIREPVAARPVVALNQLDFVLVPGVAFDLNGHRLGRGKGFYDRLLASVRGKICGVAFDQQIVNAIPVEPHDVSLNCILTPTRWCCFANPRPVLE